MEKLTKMLQQFDCLKDLNKDYKIIHANMEWLHL